MSAYNTLHPQHHDVVLDLTSPPLPTDLAQVERRLHVLRGLLDALGRIDQVNQAIRCSLTRESALQGLAREPFLYSPEQAKAILSLPLSAQSGEEGKLLRQEYEKLSSRRARLREHVAEVTEFHWFG